MRKVETIETTPILNPCPCCGEQPREYIHNDMFIIRCTNCELSIAKSVKEASSFTYSPPIVYSWFTGILSCRHLWNQRVQDSDLG